MLLYYTVLWVDLSVLQTYCTVLTSLYYPLYYTVITLLYYTTLYSLYCPTLYSLYCTTCTALHVLPYTVLTVLHYMHCTTCTALHCTHCTALHALHYMYCPTLYSLYCTTLYCTALPYTVLYCTTLVGPQVETSDGSPMDYSKYPIGSILKLYPYHACAAGAMHAKVRCTRIHSYAHTLIHAYTRRLI
jgi:hypothetical protein